MDPDCAICQAPASVACDCEARGLEVAIRQAETRMMTSIYEDIRNWVRSHARDYILEYFELLKTRRMQAHEQHMERVTAQAYHYYHAPPHPNDITAAQATLKRGIDEDWQSSVQRYPEVLEYYFSLVDLVLPNDNDPMVQDPPLSALSGSRKVTRRAIFAPPAIPNGTTVGAASSTHGTSGPVFQQPQQQPFPIREALPREALPREAITREALPRGRTPPPPVPSEHRRTPAPRDRRASFRAPAPGPGSTYYQPY